MLAHGKRVPKVVAVVFRLRRALLCGASGAAVLHAPISSGSVSRAAMYRSVLWTVSGANIVIGASAQGPVVAAQRHAQGPIWSLWRMAAYRAVGRFPNLLRAIRTLARKTVCTVPGAASLTTVTTRPPNFALLLATVAVRHARAPYRHRSTVARSVHMARKRRTATRSAVPDSSTKHHRMYVISVLLVLIHQERAFLCARLARVVAISRAPDAPSVSAARRARLPRAQARLMSMFIASSALVGASSMWKAPQSAWIVKPALSTRTKVPLRQGTVRIALKVNSLPLLAHTNVMNAHVANTTTRAPLQQAQAASSARRAALTHSRVAVPRVTATSVSAVNGALKDLTCALSAPPANTVDAPLVIALAMEALPLQAV